MNIKKILFKTTDIDVEKALPDAVIMCNSEGKILWANDAAAEIFETSKMHLLTSEISDFIDNSMNLITNAITFNRAVITKSVIKEAYFYMTAKQIEDGYVLDFRDAQPEPAEVNRRVGDEISRDKNNFLLKLANDLKSPVQSIVGFSQAMADGLGGTLSEQQSKYIKIINKNSSELMYFIDKLLELSQTETGDNTAEYKTFDITSLVNSVVRFNEQFYKDKEIKISVKYDEEFKKVVSSDEEIVKNILQDVLEVLLKSFDMGEIIINLSLPDEELIKSKGLPAGSYVMISLASSALLLSESDLNAIFDPYKIAESPNRKNVLRAIVLASVKNMVQILKGDIWIESQILKSTSFNIIIPSK